MANSLHLQRQRTATKQHIYIKPYKHSQIWLETKSNKLFEANLSGDLSRQKRYLVIRTNHPISEEWFYYKGNQNYAKIHLGLLIENKGSKYTEISCSVDRMFYSSFIIDVLHDHKIIKISKKHEFDIPGSFPYYIKPRGWQKWYNLFQYLRRILYKIINQKTHQ